MIEQHDYRRGDVIEVRSAAEILATLDSEGMVDGLPFMPEMLRFCGRRFTVDRRTDKICDTIYPLASRRVPDAVLLEDLRCDGSGHGGCQADCRLFWKAGWLRPAGDGGQLPASDSDASAALTRLAETTAAQSGVGDTSHPAPWRCQATELHRASEPMHSYDPRPYIRELRTGNVPFGTWLKVMARVVVQEPLRKLGFLKEIPLPGTGTTTPRLPRLDLEPGELVRVKSPQEIALTLNERGRNRGLWFDAEMLPYCGATYRVRQRVNKFIDERNGHMVELESDAVTLDGVVCTGELSPVRWFCPREIPPYWREGWLERAGEPAAAIPSETPSRTDPQ